MPPSNQAVIIERLEALKCDMKEIATDIKTVATGLADFQLYYEKRNAGLVEQVNANSLKIKTMEEDIKTLESEVSDLKETVNKLYSVMKILSRVFYSLLVAFLLAFSGFIWALLSDKIAIISIP